MLKNFKIKQKLYFSSFITLFFIIIISITSISILNSVVNQSFPLEKSLNEIQVKEQIAQNFMREFFLKDTKNEEFFKTGKSKNYEHFKEHMDISIKHMKTLKSSKIIQKNPKNIKDLNQLIELFEQYKLLSKERVNKVYEKGFYTYGLVGKLKNSNLKLEKNPIFSSNKDLRLILLETRKHEKDYFLRNEQSYFNNAILNAKSMISIIEKNKNINNKNIILDNLNNYIFNFKKIIEIEKNINNDTLEVYKVLKKIPSHRDEVFHNLDKLIENRNNSAKKIIYTLAIFAFTLSIFLQTYIAELISKPIATVTGVLKSTSKLDLTKNSSYNQYTNYKNEIGIMACSLQIMRKELLSMATIIKENSNLINSHSENLVSSSEEISSSSRNIASAMTSISQNNEYSSEELNLIYDSIVEFDSAMKQMEENIEYIETCSKELHQMAKKSNEEMQTTKQSIENVEKIFSDFIKKIDILANDIFKISNITDTLSSLAEQTNLLALNASIEAARAGEHGKGFSVVADEVRKLAEESQNSSKHINQLINNISKDTTKIIEGSDIVNQELKKQFTGINSGIHVFSSIVKNISKSMNQISGLNSLTNTLNNEKSIIINKISSITEFSKDNSASSQEVSASSEELTFSMEKIAETAVNLNKMTQTMLEHAEKFKI